jgi:hypothetical protein
MAYRRQNNLFEQSGIGDYVNSGDWSWQFDPPPYDFLAPSDSVAMPPPVLHGHGMGGCGCGGTCGGCGGGLGIFDTMDISTWGVGEWGAVALGVYLLFSLMGDTQRTVKRVRRSLR